MFFVFCFPFSEILSCDLMDDEDGASGVAHIEEKIVVVVFSLGLLSVLLSSLGFFLFE